MKIALLTSDNRQTFRKYDRTYPWFGTAPEALLQGFAHLPEVEVHVVCCTQQPLRSPEKLADNIYYHSLHVPKIGWLRTLYQGCIRAVRRKLREIRPDLVHGQGTERDCAIGAIFSGFPNVLTIHGNMRLIAQVNDARPFSFMWLSARLESFTIPRSGGTICITEYTREAVAALSKKTWLLPNAVDEKCFDLTPAPTGTVRLLCLATIEKRKNQNAFIRALDTLELPPNLEVIFLGFADRTLPEVKEFFELVATRPWCRYAGFANREELRAYLASSTGLVLPSLEDNCPMAVLEAMAAGVPVAAARVGGVPDLIRDGETGWLFDPLRIEDIAAALRRLLDTVPSPLAVRAREEATRRFHPRVIAARHLEIYREVLATRTG